MKSEIRDLKAGRHWSKDGTAFLQVRKTDKGVCIEIVDQDADLFYAFTIDGLEQVEFECGEASSAQKE